MFWRGNEKSSPRGLLLEFGAGNRSRTYDLRITNALLYQLSYAGKTICFDSCVPVLNSAMLNFKQNIFILPSSLPCLWGLIWKDRNHIRVFSRWETKGSKRTKKIAICMPKKFRS